LLESSPNARRLGSLITEGSYGVLPPSNSYMENGGLRFLRATELQEGNQIDWENCKRVPFEYARHERAIVKDNDILIAVKGATIASEKSVCLVESFSEQTLINGSIFRFQINQETTSKFIYNTLCLDISKRQMKAFMIQNNAVDYLSRPVLDSLVIPLPPLPIQEKLVEEMERARESRRRKLSEADALLSTLDSWLLDTLGITTPPEDNRKVFAVRLNQMNSERIDALYYSPTFIKAAEELKKVSHKVAPLKSQLKFAPLNGLDSRNYVETGQRYLRVQNVRPYQIDASDAKYVATNTTKDINLEVGDVLLTRKGTYGVAAPVTQEYVNDLISSEVILLRLAEHADISTDYLVYWLNSSLAQLMFKRLKTGGVMGHITQDVVNDFPVPIVDKTTQKIIVDKFDELREASQRLKSEAESEWQAAKDWFEAQLLGR
jgi:type I restriction enzyme S subunit